MTKIRKDQSVKSFQGGDFIKTNDILLMDIVYLDGKLCVIRVLDNTNNITDTVFCYYKRTSRGFEKIFDLNVPYNLPSSESPSLDSSDEDDDDSKPIINWADEISDEDSYNVNVPDWARIEEEDFFERKEDIIQQNQSLDVDMNQNNVDINLTDEETSKDLNIIPCIGNPTVDVQPDETSMESTCSHIKKGTSGSDNKSDILLDHEESMLVINWADEVCEIDETNIEIPEWARIPGLDFSSEFNDTETSDYDRITVANWADEAYNVNLEDVDVPDWAKIPGLDFDKESNENTICSFPDNFNVRILNWADEACNINMDDVDVPEWAKIPGIDFSNDPNDSPLSLSLGNMNIGIVNWADEVYDIDMKDVDVPEWAKIPGLDFDIESTDSANRTGRLNKRA